MRTVIRVCPRCGRPYSYIRERRVNSRVYLYAVHYYRDSSGRRRVKECYLGPKDYYKYVTRMHEKEGLVFKGLIEQERVLEYLDAIVNYVVHNGNGEEVIKHILEKIKIKVKY